MLKPKDMKIFHEMLGNSPIEVECFYYDGYVKAFANYYYYEEDCVTGSSQSAKERLAIKDAIMDLRIELQRFFAHQNIWETTSPNAGEPVKIWFRNEKWS